jgi:hypothetical protein
MNKAPNKMPGFTADVSLYTTRGRYKNSAVGAPAPDQGVVPQLWNSRAIECYLAGGGTDFWECLYWDVFLRGGF